MIDTQLVSSKLAMTAGCLAILLLVSACSSNIPPAIKQPLEGSPGIAQVRHQASDYIGQKVRWGGVILEIENKEDSSQLTVVAFPLNDDGQPIPGDNSQGRFLAIVDTFLEPQLYSAKREITFSGHLRRSEVRKVGEFSYDYPVVYAEDYYLWPVREEQSYHDMPPYWWYDPYYPWPYSYPYRAHPVHR